MKSSVRWLLTYVVFQLFSATTALPVHAAQTGPSDDATLSRGTADVSPEVAQKAAAIARQTMSPFCPGRTLSDCPSEYAAEWRKDIRKMVEEGLTPAEIQAELEKRAGGNLSGIPNRSAGYGVPLGVGLGAALILFFVFSRLRRKSEPSYEKASASAKDDSDSVAIDDERLKSELAALEDEER